MLPVNLLCIFATLGLTLVTGQLIDFKDGNVGVNFGGYHASAGLGGLLTGDGAKGGLHAEAGTPFGQAAGAGLGGGVEDDGTSKGLLYAGATAGGGVSAGAGLGGTAGRGGSHGHATAEASAGGIHKSVEKIETQKIIQAAPVQHGATLQIQKTIETFPAPAPVIVQQPAAPVYVQKTFIRRPHFHHLRKYAQLSSGFNHGPTQVVAAPQKVQVVETFKPAPVVVQKYIAPAPIQGGFITRLFAGLGTGAGASVGNEVVHTPVKTNVGYTASANINKNGALFNDIFNIPISTLNAVSRLVNNIVSGTSVSVTKNYSTSH